MQTKSRADDEDMSMEEILASIRKYVTDDYAPKNIGAKSPERPSSPYHGAQSPKDIKDDNRDALITPNPAYEAAPSASFAGGIAPDAHVPEDSGIVDLVDVIEGTPTTQRADILELTTPAVESVTHTPAPAQSPLSKHPELYELISEEADTQALNAAEPEVSLQESIHTVEPAQSATYTQMAELEEKPTIAPSSFTPSRIAEAPTELAAPSAVTPPSHPQPKTDFSSLETGVNPMTIDTKTSSEGLSQETLSASASAFSRLAQAVKPQQPQSSGTDLVAPQLQTLDVFMAGLVQPMIKDWMDKNLTRIVEQSVEREIQKITKTMMGG